MIRRYSIMVSVAFGCFIWASSFLFFPFFLNIVTISSLLIAFIWLKGIRPRIFTTGDGVRIGFIRIGVPVPNLRAGMVLRATSVITGGIFYQSRILITKYNSDQGAVGFIINKYRGDLYSDIDQTLHIGGPIQPDSVHVLHSNGTIEGCEEVIEGLYLGGRLNPRPGNMNFKTLYGYSG